MNYPHPLHMAAAIGKSPGVIRELVMMFGVNKLDTSSRTPLMFAALGNNKSSSCATLLRCSAEVDLQDISGLTALHVACYHGNKSAASILLSNKASIATRDKLVSFKKQKKKTTQILDTLGPAIMTIISPVYTRVLTRIQPGIASSVNAPNSDCNPD